MAGQKSASSKCGLHSPANARRHTMPPKQPVVLAAYIPYPKSKVRDLPASIPGTFTLSASTITEAHKGLRQVKFLTKCLRSKPAKALLAVSSCLAAFPTSATSYQPMSQISCVRPGHSLRGARIVCSMQLSKAALVLDLTVGAACPMLKVSIRLQSGSNALQRCWKAPATKMWLADWLHV